MSTDLAEPIMTGDIHRHGTVEIRLDTNFLYFRNRTQAQDFGRVYAHLYDLGAELLPEFSNEGD